jgi:membrane-bound serine protease (ClpP class)
MTAIGLVLLVIGVVLVVAEAHVPTGALGSAGAAALIAGGMIAIIAAGGSAAIALPVGVVLGLGAGGWLLFVRRELTGGPRRRIRAGSEALGGRIGEVRSWSGEEGTIFVDGSLWRARCENPSADGEAFEVGDRVSVEYVSGLTLCVRRAEEWELHA